MRALSILVVDDDVHFLKMISSVCKGDAIRKIDIADGEAEALKKLSSPGLYDVVVCDYRMPEVNGIDLVAHLRRFDPDLAVIFITGAPDTQIVLNAIQQSRTLLLAKPFSVLEFYAKLNEIASL